MLRTSLLALVLAVVSLSQVLAQAPKATLTGQVVAKADAKPVDFATVSLYELLPDAGAEGKLVDGTTTDERGRFELTDVKPGTYRAEVSFIGFETLEVPRFTLSAGQSLDLGALRLPTAAALLEEVTVTGTRALIEEKVDRLVYNADQDKLSRGGDGADVLRKVPLLQVDLDGNVSLRGSGNIRVLINNKPSTIYASTVADALKMIPAEQIKTVEVITSPSSKYDAEGAGGIINIITQKNNLAGYFLNVDTGLGLRGSNLGLNGSYRQGKFGLTLGGFGRAFYNKAGTTLEQFTNVEGVATRTAQFGAAKDNGAFGRFNLGLDYDLTDKQFLSAGVRYGLRDFGRDQLQTTNVFRDDVLANSYLRDISSVRNSNSFDYNLDYLYVIKPGQELSVSTLFSTTDEGNNFVSDNLNADNRLVSTFKNLNASTNREGTVQVDYVQPFGNTQIFEVGAKGILRQVNSDYSYLAATGGEPLASDASRPAGALDYSQNIAAAYSAYTLMLPGKITVKAGLRYERTMLDATQDDVAIDLPDYQNLVPSLNVSRKVGERSTVKVGYSRRIQRPWLQQLNPNVDLSNPNEIKFGNPALRPELTDNVELGLSTSLGKTYLNVSTFARSSANAINEVRYASEASPGVIVSTYGNIGRERALGLNLFANAYLTPKWTLNGGVDLDYAFLEGQVVDAAGASMTASNQGLNYGGRLMSQLKLDKGWSAQAFTFMRGRRVELQGARGGFGMYALGVSKDIMDRKGAIGFAAENFLGRGWNVHSELQTASFTQYSDMLLLNRNVKLTFSYKFGQLEASKARSKTRGVSNSDLMGGGDAQQGQVQPAAGGATGPQGGQKPSGAAKTAPKKD